MSNSQSILRQIYLLSQPSRHRHQGISSHGTIKHKAGPSQLHEEACHGPPRRLPPSEYLEHLEHYGYIEHARSPAKPKSRKNKSSKRRCCADITSRAQKAWICSMPKCGETFCGKRVGVDWSATIPPMCPRCKEPMTKFAGGLEDGILVLAEEDQREVEARHRRLLFSAARRGRVYALVRSENVGRRR